MCEHCFKINAWWVDIMITISHSIHMLCYIPYERPLIKNIFRILDYKFLRWNIFININFLHTILQFIPFVVYPNYPVLWSSILNSKYGSEINRLRITINDLWYKSTTTKNYRRTSQNWFLQVNKHTLSIDLNLFASSQTKISCALCYQWLQFFGARRHFIDCIDERRILFLICFYYPRVTGVVAPVLGVRGRKIHRGTQAHSLALHSANAG